MTIKRTFLPIGLAVGLFTMLLLPLFMWQGADEAHAQDVGTSAVPGLTVAISETEMTVGQTGQSTITLSFAGVSTTGITVTNINFIIDYPNDGLVTPNGDPKVLPTTPPGNIIVKNRSASRIEFQLDFGAPGITVTTQTVPVAVLNWNASKIGSDQVEIFSADVDTDGTLFGQAGTKTNGKITVLRDQTSMDVDVDTNRTLLLNQTSSGITNTTVIITGTEIYGARFSLNYDANVLEVVNVQPLGSLSKATVDTNTPGVITFKGAVPTAFTARNQTIAEIQWKAKGIGSTVPAFNTAQSFLLEKDGTDITGPVAPSYDGGGAITVSPLARILFLNPKDISVNAGSKVSQNVRLQGVSDVKVVEFRLKFDPAKIRVVDANPNVLGTQIGVDNNLFNSVGFTVNTNDVNNTSGTIDFRISGNAAINTPGGDVQVASITWEGVAAGTDALTFNQSALFDSGNAALAVTAQNGSFTVSGTVVNPTPTPTTDPNKPTPTPTITPTTVVTQTPTPTPTTDPTKPTVTPNPSGNITGRVRLQGNAKQADYKVHADNVPCNLFKPSSSNQVNATITANGTTDATFTLANKGYLCLQIVRDGYLSAQRSNPSGDFGFIEMKAGDFNGDNKIDILDLSVAGAAFGKANAKVDFNGDGTVDILDLSIVAGNYNLTGPTTNWSN